MLVPFDQLPDHSRVWIYQANREITAIEEKMVTNQVTEFCKQWSAHGEPLKTGFLILHSRFIVLSADEQFNKASGCSIDDSVGTIRNIQQLSGIDFFDRTAIAIQTNGKIEVFPLARVKEMLESGRLNGQTFTFNNLVVTKKEWEKKWLIPVSDTWLGKFIPKTTLAGPD